ncbi:MAG TPA: metallophosphoesterase [Gemmatimonadales bacterium]|nr:metallophosphoesterase [Gemmatimonadales bacterium]
MTTSERRSLRLAAIGDLHYGRTPASLLQPLFAAIARDADILALCGDLTDTGHPDEARSLARELSIGVKIPIVAVLGNHDYESGRTAEVTQILGEAGISVLDGTACEIQGIGFAGTKGFAGGFGRRALGPWGEPAIKMFVREALDEALKLETALARLAGASRRIALLHYAPICETVQGEPLEIYPYLGSSRLEEPLGRYPVDAVFHGHAHHGTPEGRTKTGVPVYNVSMGLLHRCRPDQQPFRVIELPRTSSADGGQ